MTLPYIPPLIDQLNWHEESVELPPERVSLRFSGRLKRGRQSAAAQEPGPQQSAEIPEPAVPGAGKSP
jgi:hypothetical protein